MPLLYRILDCEIRPKLYPVIDFSCRTENNVASKDVVSLIEAVKSNEYRRVKNFLLDLKQGEKDVKSIINGEDERYETALSSAVVKKNFEICRLLIANGCDVDKEAKFPPFYPRLCPVSQAVIQNSIDIVRLLLDHGCDKNKVDDYGKCPISYAVSNNHVSMVMLLLEAGCSPNSFLPESCYSLLHDACSKENLKIVKILLDGGANPNALETKDRTTPGFLTNKIEIHNELIKFGSNINWCSRSGDTVLHNAIIHGNFRLVEFLLSHGALVNAQHVKYVYSTGNLLSKISFQDPLELAAELHYFNICQVLVRHGCILELPHSENTDLWRRLLNSQDDSLLLTLLYDYLPLSSGSVDRCQNLKRVWHDIIEHGTFVSKEPPTLKASCRCTLRRHLKGLSQGKSIGCSVEHLPLPSCIKEYIMLKVW